MSDESMNQPVRGLLAKIRQAVFGLPHPPPRYAHPWSAYSPADFQKDDTARNIVPMPATNVDQPVADIMPTKAKASVALFAQNRRPQPSGDSAALSQVNPCETPSTSISVLEAVIHKLMEKQGERKRAAAQTRSAPRDPAERIAAGIDFQLAARLRSVSVLNRKVTTASAASATRRSGMNRPVDRLLKAKRRLGISPPAVLRKKRLSADVVYLKRTLVRPKHQQVSMSKAA